MSDSGSTEAEILQNLIPKLREEGYEEIFVNPRPPIVPPFLERFSPDLIARRGSRHLVVEIVRSLNSKTKALQELTEAVRANTGWELRVIVTNSSAKTNSLPRQSRETITKAIGEVGKLIESDHLGAALLVGWGIFEAVGRSFLPDELGRPQSPARVVQFLAQEGWVTPEEADKVRSLARKRSEYIHGNLQIEISKNEVIEFYNVLALLDEALGSQ